jgi:hypothetical protein
MQGVTGSFAVNGVKLQLQPSASGWVTQEQVGVDGNFRPIYPAIRQYKMTWDVMSHAELKQLIDIQLACVTGSVVVDLPKWGDATYTFYSYSGTFVNEPEIGGEYFAEHITDVSLLFQRIRTN